MCIVILHTHAQIMKYCCVMFYNRQHSIIGVFCVCIIAIKSDFCFLILYRNWIGTVCIAYEQHMWEQAL